MFVVSKYASRFVSTITTLHTLSFEDGRSESLSMTLPLDILSSLPHLHASHYQSLRRCLCVEVSGSRLELWDLIRLLERSTD